MKSTAHRRDAPNFIIIGAMKSGTTSLYHDLSTVQGIFLPSNKEPGYLASTHSVKKIQSQYNRHFSNCTENDLCGEASTVYTMRPNYPDVAKTAMNVCGSQLKLIMIVRDPIERIYSHLRHDLASGEIKIEKVNSEVLNNGKYCDYSNYSMQLESWVQTFGVNNLLCIKFTDYVTNRNEVIQRTLNFLRKDTDLGDGFCHHLSNSSDSLRKTPRWLGAFLRTPLYRHYIRAAFSEDQVAKIRNLVLPRATVPKFKLEIAVEEELKQRLCNIESELSSLLGYKFRFDE